MTVSERGRRDRESVLAAMRSREWLRTQWIGRVAFGLGTSAWRPTDAARTRAALTRLEQEGMVESRVATEHRNAELCGGAVHFDIPRTEWRLREPGSIDPAPPAETTNHRLRNDTMRNDLIDAIDKEAQYVPEAQP